MRAGRILSAKPRTDDSLECFDLMFRHGVAARKVVRREQEHVVDAGLVTCPQQTVGAPFR